VQIEIDFQVFKALTALRESETDSYNAVIRRLLSLPTKNALEAAEDGYQKGDKVIGKNELRSPMDSGVRSGLFGSGRRKSVQPSDGFRDGLLSRYLDGIWINNTHFPEGTRFRATYKGETFYAEIKDGKWVGSDGKIRTSPSDAASAISNTNVNGWRFWFAQLPNDPSWRRLDEFKA
jgi:hypothetical protein